MQDFAASFFEAFRLVFSLDPDLLAETSLSRRNPSGVHSKVHDRMTAGKNPIERTITTARMALSDRPNTGNSVSATWIRSQAAAT